MTWWRRFVRRGAVERQLDAELRDHFERQVDDLVRSGLGQAEARRRAVLAVGGLEQIKEQCRDARGTRFVEDCIQDTRYACRTLAKRPGFTVAAVLLLALGIGANTAMFSLLETVLFRDVRVDSPADLYFVAHRHGERTHASSNYPLLERLRSRTEAFAGVTAYTITSFKVSSADDIELVNGNYVAGNYHGLLGVRFSRGHGFVAEDDRTPVQGLVAVISDRYWTRSFNRAPDVVGRRLTVDGRSLAIIGVTAAGFEGFTPGRPSDITLPLSQKVLNDPDYLRMHDTWTSLTMVARLTPGVVAEQATSAVDVVFRQYLSEPENAWYKVDSPVLQSASQGSGELRQRYLSSLTVLMVMVVVVLVIASANFAHLQLARASARVKEMSIRLSIGAGRGRLVRQLLAESLVLAGLAGALGHLLAIWGTATIAGLFRAAQYPIELNVQTNATVLAFTAGIAIVAGLVFGLTPALAATRIDLVSALKDAPSSRDRRHRRWNARRVLVVGQVALCLLLVAGAGLLVRTLQNLQAPDANFSGQGVVLFALDGRDQDIPDEYWPSACSQLVDRLRANPEIDASACSTSTPIDMRESRRGAVAGGTPVQGGVLANVVSPGFFKTFSVSLVRGRLLTPEDSPASQPVAVINERLAKMVFGNDDPMGRTFNFGATPKALITIVGIVRDVRHSPRDQASPTVYTPLGQGGEIEGRMTVSVRSATPAAVVGRSVRSMIRSANPTVLVGMPRTLGEQVNGQLVRERSLAFLSGWFGVLALVLACVGLYGVMSQEVTRRRREIGIRLALGADASRVLGAVIRDGATVALAGIALGTVIALFVAKLMAGLLFEVSARDPLTFVAAAGILMVTTLVAGFLPARRAASVDPAEILKTE